VADAECITVANLSATVLSVFRWLALHCTARISSMHSVLQLDRLSVMTHFTESVFCPKPQSERLKSGWFRSAADGQGDSSAHRGAGPKIGSTLPAQKCCANNVRFRTPISCIQQAAQASAQTVHGHRGSTSAYWGEAVQGLSWRCVANDPQQPSNCAGCASQHSKRM
jgi:hypothetical protein